MYQTDKCVVAQVLKVVVIINLIIIDHSRMIQAFRIIEISKYDDDGQLTTRGQLMQGSSIPDSIPPSDRRWLLVARSADFADVGPTVACQPLFMLDFSIFCRRWADVGPTVDFYSRWRRAIIGDLGKLRKKLLIMVYLKVIFQSAHKF